MNIHGKKPFYKPMKDLWNKIFLYSSQTRTYTADTLIKDLKHQKLRNILVALISVTQFFTTVALENYNTFTMQRYNL